MLTAERRIGSWKTTNSIMQAAALAPAGVQASCLAAAIQEQDICYMTVYCLVIDLPDTVGCRAAGSTGSAGQPKEGGGSTILTV